MIFKSVFAFLVSSLKIMNIPQNTLGSTFLTFIFNLTYDPRPLELIELQWSSITFDRFYFLLEFDDTRLRSISLNWFLQLQQLQQCGFPVVKNAPEIFEAVSWLYGIALKTDSGNTLE